MTEGGSEVLRYIGDASLAIFPFERYADERAACQAALDVALNAVARGEQVNVDRVARGEPLIECGTGLHTGTVMYANISTSNRIEFTVIGKAANEAVFDAHASRLQRTWRSHGAFDLRNIGHPIEIPSPAPRKWV